MPEQQNDPKAEDLKKRVDSFNAGLKKLLKDFNLVLGAAAFITPDGRVGANPQILDGDEVKRVQEAQKAKQPKLESSDAPVKETPTEEAAPAPAKEEVSNLLSESPAPAAA